MVDWTWITIGSGAAVAAAARIAYLHNLDGSASAARGHREGMARGRDIDLKPLVAVLTPRSPSLLIAGGVGIPSLAYFVQTTVSASMYAGAMFGCFYLAGEAVDRWTGPAQNPPTSTLTEPDVAELSTAIAVLFGTPTAGKLVQATGYSVASVWFTSQVSGQLATLVVVCTLGGLPSAYEIRTAWIREGEWLRVAMTEWVCATTGDVFRVGHTEVSEGWDAHGLGATASYAEAFGMLSSHADGRIRQLAAALAEKLDDLPGVPTAVANVAERGMVGVATVALRRVLLTPESMLQANPALSKQAMTKRTCLNYLNQCGDTVTTALRSVLEGRVNPLAFISGELDNA
eukprot:m.106142 g.106142  ORF g.106142 m.106142 type:complete len:345 (+) comp21066_c0_seq1:81-1115(+)